MYVIKTFVGALRPRLENFYRTRLHGRRPVLVYVDGRDVCRLLQELQALPEARDKGTASMDRGPPGSAAGEGRTPLALLTAGWDANGSPFSDEQHGWDKCSFSLLALPQVVRWFLSHEVQGLNLPKVGR